MKVYGTDMTEGDIKNHILKFATPLFIGNLLQISYSIVNRVWAGKFLSKDALGAVAICSIYQYIILSFAIGLTMATNILISQYYGSKNYKSVNKIVSNSFIIIGIISVVLTIAVNIFAEHMLRIINTPDDILIMASGYLTIMSYGLIFVFGFNLISFIFRGIGDSKTPLKFLFISVVINIVLDPILMIGVGPFSGIGVNGAALGLIISQGVAFILSFIYLQKKGGIVSLNLSGIKFDKEVSLKIIKLGVPTGIQQIFISVGLAVVQSDINFHGKDAIAAYAAVGNLDSLLFQPASSLNTAVASIVGQNLGAEKIARVKETLKHGLIICTYITGSAAVFSLIVPKIFILPFVNSSDINVIQIGVNYLRITAIPYIFVCCMVTCYGFFNGTGNTVAPMILALIGLWGLRIPLVKMFSMHWGINGIWMGIGLSFILIFVIGMTYYRYGRWRQTIGKGLNINL
jgi:putative MATE family efflux protein